MAFSIRKMLSNMNYFKKSDDNTNYESNDVVLKRRHNSSDSNDDICDSLMLATAEPDSTSKCLTNINISDTVPNNTSKMCSLSDTDCVLTANIDKTKTKRQKRRSKKLKLDVIKASKSAESVTYLDNSDDNVENTPKHILLKSTSADTFSEKLKSLDFNKSFEIFDVLPTDPSVCEDDIESLSDNSESNASITSGLDEEEPIKMCRKISSDQPLLMDNILMIPSTTPESFGDVEYDQNEEDRVSLLQDYQARLQKLENGLKKLLLEFQFHIDVSKVFNQKSMVTSMLMISSIPGESSNLPKSFENLSDIQKPNQINNWNYIIDKQDEETKLKIKKQMVALKKCLNSFIKINFNDSNTSLSKNVPEHTTPKIKAKQYKKQNKINNKKKFKAFDYPDLREELTNLFSLESEIEPLSISTSYIKNIEEADKCICQCHCSTPSLQVDSGVTTKSDQSVSQSITSSIGNFSLDSTVLSAYSESLDQIVSFTSFQDTSLYSTLLQKAAIERITFYVQVHSIQLKCEKTDQEFESKNIITFHCPSCKSTEVEENGLLRHILSQDHCEKVHFAYKTAYIKKCVSTGKEIQPSTVLNPMTMYRDDNKIVCFGDAMYACSLCFENLIVGESVLMGHCSEPDHIERKLMLQEIVE